MSTCFPNKAQTPFKTTLVSSWNVLDSWIYSFLRSLYYNLFICLTSGGWDGITLLRAELPMFMGLPNQIDSNSMSKGQLRNLNCSLHPSKRLPSKRTRHLAPSTKLGSSGSFPRETHGISIVMLVHQAIESFHNQPWGGGGMAPSQQKHYVLAGYAV